MVRNNVKDNNGTRSAAEQKTAIMSSACSGGPMVMDQK